MEAGVLPIIREFLSERGLELSEEKTVITHIEDGFDFLGCNIRWYKDKLLTKPSKKNYKAIVNKIRGIIKQNPSMKQEDLIRKLNPNVPYFLFGHSMGSFMARRYIMTYGNELDGVIISGTGNQSGSVLKAGKIMASLTKFFKGDRYRSKMLKICFSANLMIIFQTSGHQMIGLQRMKLLLINITQISIVHIPSR